MSQSRREFLKSTSAAAAAGLVLAATGQAESAERAAGLLAPQSPGDPAIRMRLPAASVRSARTVTVPSAAAATGVPAEAARLLRPADADPLAAEMYGLEGLAVAPDGSMLFVADGTRGDPLLFNRVRVIARAW